MEKLLSYLPVISLCIGGWMVLNGVLHDIVVLRSYNCKKCGQDLLRFLMDGHILITCGIMQMIVYAALKNNDQWAYYIVGIACVSLIVYCAMILPFLTSIGALARN